MRRHQQAAELVVHLARDAGALLLAHRVGVGREFAQVLQRLREGVRAFADALLQHRMRLAQRVLGLAARRDVDKGDHRALHHAAFDDGVGGILDREGAAVLAPEQLGVDAAGQGLAEGVEDGAQLLGVVRAAGMRVVREFVHVAAQHLLRFVSRAARRRPG